MSVPSPGCRTSVPVLFAFAWLAAAFQPAAVQASDVGQLRVLVLLDLSDRIDPSRTESRYQSEIDRQILRRIVATFVEEVRRKRYVLSRDSLQIHVAPQPIAYRGDLVSMADSLRIDVSSIPLWERRNQLPRVQEEIGRRIDGLYSLATRERHLVGADLWSFFRNNLEDLLPCPRAGEDHRNVLIVVTDGYLDFDEPFQSSRPRQGSRTSYMQVARYRDAVELLHTPGHGLIPGRSNALRCVEVLVLEMRERRVGDREVLQVYWVKWLQEMGVARYELKMGGDSAAAAGDFAERFLAWPAHRTEG